MESPTDFTVDVTDYTRKHDGNDQYVKRHKRRARRWFRRPVTPKPLY